MFLFSLVFSNQGNSLVFQVISAIFLCFSRCFTAVKRGKNPWCFGGVFLGFDVNTKEWKDQDRVLRSPFRGLCVQGAQKCPSSIPLGRGLTPLPSLAGPLKLQRILRAVTQGSLKPWFPNQGSRFPARQGCSPTWTTVWRSPFRVLGPLAPRNSRWKTFVFVPHGASGGFFALRPCQR